MQHYTTLFFLRDYKTTWDELWKLTEIADGILRAGREAYLAAMLAAMAYVVAQTGKHPRTHRGTRTEFNRLALLDSRIEPAHVTLLGFAYESKQAADYEGGIPISLEMVDRALTTAAAMVDRIALTLVV